MNPRRKEGSLEFIEENGSIKSHGISVGSFAPRGYIRGGGKAQAKFTFEQVKESDLRNDKLFLNVWLRAFRTKALPDEFVKGQIFLRRPKGDLISNPITFDANSFTNLAIAFPRKLSASDPNGESRVVDLCVEKGPFFGEICRQVRGIGDARLKFPFFDKSFSFLGRLLVVRYLDFANDTFSDLKL